MKPGWYIFRSYRGGAPELWLTTTFPSAAAARERAGSIHFDLSGYEIHIAKISETLLVKLS